MTFTEQAKEQAQASWQGSFQHPFITELHEGTLSSTIFRYYLIQDHYYLKHFSQLYRLIAAQTQQPRLKKLLLTNAENLALGELAIRETFFEELAITEEEVAATPIAPTAYHYVSHMYRQLIEGTPK
ncbi:MAG: thiaminase II, partial [Enterococcus faecalis]|nr:thiaminase II [Enterococcus faecalis]